MTSAKGEKEIKKQEVADAEGVLLVADDDWEMRSLLASALKRRRYRVILAGDGLEIFAQIAKVTCTDPPGVVSLVITDVRMPGLSGLEALERLKSEHPEIPVIIISAFMDDEVRQEANRLGAVALFDKPFDLRRLLHTVNHILDS